MVLIFPKTHYKIRATAFNAVETLETERVQYTLPDGSSLDIGPARFRAPEVLFRSVVTKKRNIVFNNPET